jgi:hypothetical protein
MGRKLIRRMPTEKDKSNKIPKGHIAIIVAQHVLLYSSGYVIASTAYLIHTGIITNDLLPAAVILVFAVSLYKVGRHVSQLTGIGLCINCVRLPLQRDSMAMVSTRWEKLFDITSVSGNSIQVRHPICGHSLDGGYRARYRFHSREASVVSRVCESTTALSGDRRWRTVYNTTRQCCRESLGHVRIFR